MTMISNLELRGIREDKVYCGPRAVQIDLTNKCDQQCIYCWDHSPYIKQKKPRQWNNCYMDSKKIIALVRELAKLKTKIIQLSGSGEPFMHADIMKIVKAIKDNGIYLRIVTNLTALKEQDIPLLAKYKVDELSINISAGNPKSYKTHHPNMKKSTFAFLKKRIKAIKKISPKTKITLINVITNKNFQDIKQIFDFAIEVKADDLFFKIMGKSQGTEFLYLKKEHINALKNEIERIMKQKIYLEINNNLEFIRRMLLSKNIEKGFYSEEILNNLPCYIGWDFARIMVDGKVSFCCTPVIIVGNIKNKNFRDIWESKKYAKLRKEGKNMKIDRLCKNYSNCVHYIDNLRIHETLMSKK